MLSIGLDIGGANTKLVALERRSPARPEGGGSICLRAARNEYFPFWQRFDDFKAFLQGMLADLLAQPHQLMVTMTAELADCFKTKREGVSAVLSTVRGIDSRSRVLLNSGAIVPIDTALSSPLAAASANWLAPALVLGRTMKECIFIDVGTTTTDIIPVKNGRPCVRDTTDKGRLSNHELVYSGALRTNLASQADRIMLHGQPIELASEYFANAGDVNVLLGLIDEDQYSVPTPDGGDTCPEGARIRISRLICSDATSVSMEDAVQLASFLHREQVDAIASHLMTVMVREGFGSDLPCVTAGMGRKAIATPAARQAGLMRVEQFHESLAAVLSLELGDRGGFISDQAPAASLALLTCDEGSQCG